MNTEPMMITGKDEIKEYFNRVEEVVKHEWEQTFNTMTPSNIDLKLVTEPILDTTYDSMSCNKKIRLSIFDDPHTVKVVSSNKVVSSKKPKKRTSDVLIQLWDVESQKSLIYGLDIREDCEMDWSGDKIPLTKPEKVLTSWLLDSSEGKRVGPRMVIDDIVKSVSEKNGFHNVFSVLY